MNKINKLRLVLGDQLNASHSWYKQKDDQTAYLICELKQETDYVAHHVQKICAFFLSMQQFAAALKDAGHRVLYLTLDDSSGYADLPSLLEHLIKEYKVQQFEFQQPDEWRLDKQLTDFARQLDIPFECVDSEHFLISRSSLSEFLKGGKTQRMEAFYRKLRRKFNVLMDGDKPVFDKWNFDTDNRKKLSKKDIEAVPEPLMFANDVTGIISRLERHQINTIGTASEQLLWPTNRQQALQLLEWFCTHALPNFGRFQDAMTHTAESKNWSLYHSRLSYALNCKILHPMQVIEHAISAYEKSNTIDIAQIEGFVRQIMGWREFIRGIYWLNMPQYKDLNELQAERQLPDWFWSGDTKMQCMHHAIKQSLDYSYAHHIQRLMITGNFCMLTGIDPDQVDEWYLGIYIDAIEWVELPNTRGMSQFADGGLVGSKAYAASGNYVHKMSDYCGSCHYDVKQKTGDTACPLNSLYWQFMISHRKKFEKNPRTSMVYRNWDKQPELTQQRILEQAAIYLQELEVL